jgi:uncharacterized protein YegL
MLRLAPVLVALALSSPAPLFAQLVTRGGAASEVALTTQTVTATLEDGLACVAVRQVFRYDGPSEVEAVYTFPLPAEASLTGLVLTVAGDRLEGALTERKQARRVYDDILHRRRDPALIEQIGDGLFRLSVFPVVPNVDTVVELEYVQRAPLFEGAFHLTVPLGGASARSAATTATIDVRSSAALGSVTASLPDALVQRDGARRAIVSWERSAGTEPPAGLALTAMLADGEPSFDVTTYRDTAGDGWFVAVYSPGTPSEQRLLPRDVLLVLDTSGSMQGHKLAEAKRSAHWLIDHLREQDRVNIVRFSSDVTAALPDLALATPETRATLHAAIDRFTAVGSTALGDALVHVASVPPVEGRARTVVLLTDGRPTFGETSPTALIELARKIGEAGLRLHTFGVGDDVDEGLLRGAAAAGRGHAELFANALEVEPRLRRFLSRTGSPVLRELALTARGVAVSGLHPRIIPDAYLGEQVVFAGRFDGHGPAAFELVGKGAEGAQTSTDVLMVPEVASGRRSVGLQYALLKLTDLEEARRMRAGLDDAAYRSAARAWADIDRGAYATSEELVDELIRTSLQHGVQCAFTSFIAVEEADRHRVGVEAYAAAVPSEASQQVLGSIGIAGGRYGGRVGGSRNLRASGGAGTEQVLKDGLEWLKREHLRAGAPWTLRAEALALLAYQGDGHVMDMGIYGDVATELTRRLTERVDPTTGTFADTVSASRRDADGALDHLLATLALTEAYHVTKSSLLRATVVVVLARAEALCVDPATRAALSPEALCVALELQDLAVEAQLDTNGLALAAEEVRRRAAAGESSLMVAVASLQGTSTGPEREALAADVAARAIAALGPAAGTQTALRLWRVSDVLRSIGGPAWATFNRHRKVVVMDSQRMDAEFKGSWQVAQEGDERSEAIATTAINVLVLEADFRLTRRPR